MIGPEFQWEWNMRLQPDVTMQRIKLPIKPVQMFWNDKWILCIWYFLFSWLMVGEFDGIEFFKLTKKRSWLLCPECYESLPAFEFWIQRCRWYLRQGDRAIKQNSLFFVNLTFKVTKNVKISFSLWQNIHGLADVLDRRIHFYNGSAKVLVYYNWKSKVLKKLNSGL